MISPSGTTIENTLLDWIAQNEAAGIQPGEAVYYDDAGAGALALASGRADVNMMPYAVAKFHADTAGETRVVGRVSGTYPVSGQVAATTARGNGLVVPVQAVLNALITDGTYDAVLARWGQQDEAVAVSEVNPPGLPIPNP